MPWATHANPPSSFREAPLPGYMFEGKILLMSMSEVLGSEGRRASAPGTFVVRGSVRSDPSQIMVLGLD